MGRKRLFAVAGCAAVLIAGAVVFHCVHRPKVLYRVTFLPTMGGVETRPHAINDSGRVVNAVRWADGTVHVVVWDKSDRTEDLAFFPKGHQVVALALNNAGQIAGSVVDPNRTSSSFFRDSDGRMYMLDAPTGGETQIGAMNGRGQVVGHWHATRGPRHAFIWDKAGGMQDLGTFGGLESLACDINDGGQIVGFYSTGGSKWRAFICDPNLGMQELGPTRFGPAATCRVNNRGFVVGQFGSEEDEYCVSTWTAGTGPQRLSSLGGDWVAVRALDDTNRYFLNVYQKGVRVLGRELWYRSESHLWESGRHIRCVDRHIGRADIDGMGIWDVNKDGTILALLATEKLPYPHAVILEPILQ